MKHSNPQVGPDEYEARPSQFTPPPVDDEGIPMMPTHEVAPLFGIGHLPNARHVSYDSIPQYVETKGLKQTSNRTWFSLAHVVGHLQKAASINPGFADTHQKYAKRLSDARAEISRRKESGVDVGNLKNQPHPGNKASRLEFLPYGRVHLGEKPGSSNVDSNTEVGTGSNLDIVRRQGNTRSVESAGKSPDLTALETRPGRLQRRSRK